MRRQRDGHSGGEPSIREVADGVVLTVHVQPGARRSEVTGRHGDALKVKVVAPATDGRANAAVVALLAEAFGLRPSDVSLVAGATSRRKQIALRGLDQATAATVLEQITA